MTILRPRVWHICDECGEFFYYEKDIPKICPDCNKGKLIKKCTWCGNEYNKCECSKEKLKSMCSICGFEKTKCICK